MDPVLLGWPPTGEAEGWAAEGLASPFSGILATRPTLPLLPQHDSFLGNRLPNAVLTISPSHSTYLNLFSRWVPSGEPPSGCGGLWEVCGLGSELGWSGPCWHSLDPGWPSAAPPVSPPAAG